MYFSMNIVYNKNIRKDQLSNCFTYILRANGALFSTTELRAVYVFYLFI